MIISGELMPETKVFTYETDGLSYTVTVYEEDGVFKADIKVEEGAMDVNAVYFGDDNFTGESASLDVKSLNMNDGDDTQWDQAVKLSDPGLGNNEIENEVLSSDGDLKDTYLQEGDTLTIELDISNLDDIDFFGIRATSTSTPEGSIKAVSEEECEEEPIFDKIGFGTDIGDNKFFEVGDYIRAEYLGDKDPTFENYLDYYLQDHDIENIENVIFFEFDENNNPLELYRITAPEEGFESEEELLEAFDAAVKANVFDGVESLDCFADLFSTEPPQDEDEEHEDDLDEVCMDF